MRDSDRSRVFKTKFLDGFDGRPRNSRRLKYFDFPFPQFCTRTVPTVFSSTNVLGANRFFTIAFDNEICCIAMNRVISERFELLTLPLLVSTIGWYPRKLADVVQSL